VGADRRLVHAYGEGAGEHGIEDGWHWIPGNFSSRHIPCCFSSMKLLTNNSAKNVIITTL
jgi:hypothetical protein